MPPDEPVAGPAATPTAAGEPARTLAPSPPAGRPPAARPEWLAASRRAQALDLARMPAGDRPLVALLLAIVVASSALVVLVAAAIPLPGGTIRVPGGLIGGPEPIAVPAVPVILAWIGAAVVAGTAARGAARAPGPTATAVRLAVALVGVFLALRAVQLVQARPLPGGEWLASGEWLPSILVGAGLVVAAAALVAGLVPAGRWRRGRGLLLVAPFLYPLVLALAGGLLAPPDDLLSALVARAIPGAATFGPDVTAALAYTTLVYLVPAVLLPYLLWQAAAWARASRREIGIDLAGNLLARAAWVFPLLLALKLGWLLAGYAGLLPEWLGGGRPVWGSSSGDGPIGWILAGALATLAGAWLLHARRTAIDEEAMRPAVVLVVAGFGGATAVAVGLLYLATVGALAGATAAAPIVSAGEAVLDLILPTQALTVFVAAVLGVVLLWRRGPTSPVLFLLVFAAWSLPRAVGVVVAPDAPSSPAAIEPATLDAMISALVGGLAALWYAGAQRRVGPLELGLVLVVSTMLAHGGTFVPLPLEAAASVVALLFPVAYLLLFDARGINEAGSIATGSSLRRLAIAAGLLLLVAAGLALGGTPQLGASLGALLFAVPFTAMLVAAAIARAGAPDDPGPHGLPLHARATRSPVGAAVAGLVLVIVTGVSVAAVALGDGDSPSPDPRIPRAAAAVEPAATSGGYALLELDLWSTSQVVPALSVLQALDAALGPDADRVRDPDGARAAALEIQRLASLRSRWIVPDEDATCALQARADHEALEDALRGLAVAVLARTPTDAGTGVDGDDRGDLVLAGEQFSLAAGAYAASYGRAVAACPDLLEEVAAAP